MITKHYHATDEKALFTSTATHYPLDFFFLELIIIFITESLNIKKFEL